MSEIKPIENLISENKPKVADVVIEPASLFIDVIPALPKLRESSSVKIEPPKKGKQQPSSVSNNTKVGSSVPLVQKLAIQSVPDKQQPISVADEKVNIQPVQLAQPIPSDQPKPASLPPKHSIYGRHQQRIQSTQPTQPLSSDQLKPSSSPAKHSIYGRPQQPHLQAVYGMPHHQYIPPHMHQQQAPPSNSIKPEKPFNVSKKSYGPFFTPGQRQREQIMKQKLMALNTESGQQPEKIAVSLKQNQPLKVVMKNASNKVVVAPTQKKGCGCGGKK